CAHTQNRETPSSGHGSAGSGPRRTGPHSIGEWGGRARIRTFGSRAEYLRRGADALGPREVLGAECEPFGGAHSLVYDSKQPAAKVVGRQRRHVVSGNAIRLALRIERRPVVHESRL